MSTPYDALLLLSFGGPEGPDDVLPFLENVVRGRGVPRERLLEVAEHYQHFGGVSPINEQNRALLAAIRAELDLPVYWGNRNWDPMVEDAVARMRDDGVRRALVFVTSAYTSFSGCRQYQEDMARAQAAAGPLRTMAAKSIPGFKQFEDVWDTRAPLGWDIGDPSPVAKTCVALLSDWMPATTGEIVHVDGGFHATGV